MIAKIMAHLNNHFARSVESSTYEFVTDGIVGTFSETYITGMYIWVKGSYLNDGVFKLTGVTANKLTVAADTFMPENTDDILCIFACTPPRDFLEIVTEVEGAKSNDGVASESIDDYSVSFTGDGGWQSTFRRKLDPYRQMYDDDRTLLRNYPYNIRNKGGGCCGY